MKRLCMEKLVEWKHSPSRKPLLLTGARQVGKTWLVKEFGRTQFKSLAYISFESNERMARLFAGDITPSRLIPALSLEAGVPIQPASTLVVFDEVQEVPRALTSLKYFNENAPEYAVIATGSSLGVTVHPGTSFPVGQVHFQKLYPLSFREFLMACGEEGLSDLIADADTEMMSVFHERILEQLKYYLIIGGMPEAVREFAEARPAVDFRRIGEVQARILRNYRDDFSKHSQLAPRGLPLRLNQVWDSIPSQLSRENKKFMYTAVRESGRGRDFELAIQWLVDTSLALKATRLVTPQYPLKMHKDFASFKLFLSDVGLLRTMAGINPAMILRQNDIFATAKGAFAEQYVCQQLAAQEIGLHYWSADNSTAELDFVAQGAGEVIPIEVKSGLNLQAKSLKAAVKRFGFERAIRFSPLPPKRDGKILDMPLYAVESLGRML